MSEYKFKLSKAEQEMGTMEQNVSKKEKSHQANNSIRYIIEVQVLGL